MQFMAYANAPWSAKENRARDTHLAFGMGQAGRQKWTGPRQAATPANSARWQLACGCVQSENENGGVFAMAENIRPNVTGHVKKLLLTRWWNGRVWGTGSRSKEKGARVKESNRQMWIGVFFLVFSSLRCEPFGLHYLLDKYNCQFGTQISWNIHLMERIWRSWLVDSNRIKSRYLAWFGGNFALLFSFVFILIFEFDSLAGCDFLCLPSFEEFLIFRWIFMSNCLKMEFVCSLVMDPRRSAVLTNLWITYNANICQHVSTIPPEMPRQKFSKNQAK